MDEKLQKAQCLARFILGWHEQNVKKRILQKKPEVPQKYKRRVEYLVSLQLDNPENLQAIAEEQIRGVFEQYYSEPVDGALWLMYVQNIFPNLAPPTNLGNVALHLRQLVNDLKIKVQLVSLGTLPEGWQSTAHPLEAISVKVEGASPLEAREMLRAVFEPFTKFEDAGIGGRELMLAMNEDLLEKRNIWERERDFVEKSVTVYGPGAFDFQLATGDGNLSTEVIEGHIRLVEVILG